MDSEHYSFPPNTIDDLFKYCKHWIATNDPDNRYLNWTRFHKKVMEEQEEEEERLEAHSERIMKATLELQKRIERLNKERKKNRPKKKSASGRASASARASGRASASARIGGKKKRKSCRHKKKKRNKTIRIYT